MEMLRIAGVADEVMAASYGLGKGLTIKIAETVQGPIFQTIVRGTEDYDTSAISPAPFGMASQDAVEPILLTKAKEYGAKVRLSTELISVEQGENGVTARLLDRTNEHLTTIRADYVIAADGHRSPMREKLGITRHGKGPLNNAIGVLFDADLSAYVDPDSVALYYLQNETFTGVFVNTAVPNQHLFGFDYHPERGESFTDFTVERVTELIRVGLNDPDVRPEVKVIQAWEIGAHVADRFADGRIFLAGDAAKVTPPTGGMGGNTAIGDGYDIAWKLADVITSSAGPGLLDSYDAERRPYAEQVVIASLHNAKIRLAPTLDLSDVPDPLDVFAIGFGLRCRSNAVIIDDDDQAPTEDPTKPTGRPGFRAPHVPVTVNGTALSTIDLYGNCWVLVANDDSWTAAADEAANVFGVGLMSYRIGADLIDPTGQLADRYGIGDAGASLIRPDGVVAWRTKAADTEPTATLVTALARLLDRTDVIDSGSNGNSAGC
jgi:aklavinone 12-hydroxylase